jgi:ABC-2 type transport system ATP-binding protein
MSTVSIIETKNLRKVYRNGFVAVDSLDLTVPEGQVFGFLGPNGAGKTTTIGMLIGNVFPSGGSGTVLGQKLGHREARRQMGYLPEKFQFHDFLTATEFLDLHGKLYGMSLTERKRRIPIVLEQVGLALRAQSRLKEFSRGMQQRVGLAQAILHEPRLVILDEPTSALDPVGRRAVKDLVVALKAQGTTIVINSHLLSEIEQMCDQVAIIRQGKILKQGAISHITGKTGQVMIELEALPEGILQLLAPLAVVSREGNILSLTPNTNIAIADIIGAIVAKSGRIVSVIPVQQTLEDLFVDLMS